MPPLGRLSSKCSANPITVTPIWKCEFVNWGYIGFFLKHLFSNFGFHIKDSKWDRKCIFTNCVSCNGSPQQIVLQQFPFANEAKPRYNCRAFWAKCYEGLAWRSLHLFQFNGMSKKNQRRKNSSIYTVIF